MRQRFSVIDHGSPACLIGAEDRPHNLRTHGAHQSEKSQDLPFLKFKADIIKPGRAA